MRNKLTPILIATLFTIVFLHPVLIHISTHLPSRADGVLISWLIYSVSTALEQALNIFDLQFFHPFTNTLAYSDPFFSTAITTLPLLSFTTNIVAIHNIHLIFGSIVMYLSMYFLTKELKYSKIGQHLSAFLFTFSVIHLHYIVHLQSYLLAGIPLTTYFLLKWQKTENWIWLTLSHAAFLYQFLNSPMSGFFLIFSLIPLFALNMNFRQIITKHKYLFFYYLILSCGIVILFYYPYFTVSQQFQYVRSMRDTAHFAHSFNRFFHLDFLILYLVLALLWKSKKQSLENKQFNFSTFQILFVIAIGAILMLGPVLKINGATLKILEIPIPLPYAVLYYIIPGFKAFRDSSRWILLLNFGLALLAGKLAANSKLTKSTQTLIFGGLLLSYYFLSQNQMKLYQIPTQTPIIYQAVKTAPQKVLAEFPVFSWRMMPYAYLENDRLMYQTIHKKTLYNGVSGFTPPQREFEWEWLWKEFPSSESLLYLQSQGVELIVVHYNLYEEMHDAHFSYANHTSPSAVELQKEIESRLPTISCNQGSCLYLLKNTN